MTQKYHWYRYDDGKTLGTTGSESGVILMDEEHSLGARITLEESKFPPYGITCGIYGCMVHTTFAGSRQEAQETYAAMKKRLGRFLEELAAMPEEEAMKYLGEWAETFTRTYQ
jgi:hypothetical protein